MEEEDHDSDDQSRWSWQDPKKFFESIYAAQRANGGRGIVPPEILTFGQVCSRAYEYRTRVLQDWALLNEILQRHEITIQKRWLKKTKEQRRRLLLAAWPGMALPHRPDYEAFMKVGDAPRPYTQYRTEFIWPEINQEDLLQPRSLLQFIKARGRNHPANFAQFDDEMTYFGVVNCAFVRYFLNDYTMWFTPARYGTVTSWDEDEDGFDAARTGVAMPPGDGLVALERAKRILDFLIRCCKGILQDVPEDDLVSESYPPRPEPSLPVEPNLDHLSMASMAIEAPYQLPTTLDLSRVISLLSAKVSAARDHFWALREDPSYFADRLEQYKQHRQELILDQYGQPHPLFKAGREDILWHRVIKEEIICASLGLESWTELHKQAVHLSDLQQRYSRQINFETPLPEEFLDALLTFRHWLKQHCKSPFGQLKASYNASPNARKYWIRMPQEGATSTKMLFTTKASLRSSPKVQRFIWLLSIIWNQGDELWRWRIPFIVDQVDYIMRTQTEVADTVSAFIAEVFGNLSVSAECLRQLENYQPWARQFEEQLWDREPAIKEKFAQKTQAWPLVGQLFDTWPQADHVRLADPSDKKFLYPVEKRKNESTVNAMRRAEENLDAFWDAFDERYMAILPKTDGARSSRE